MSKKLTKFIRGPMITSLHEVVVALEAGRFLYLNHKPLSPGFYQNWQMHEVAKQVRRGNLFQALENKAWWERECR